MSSRAQPLPLGRSRPRLTARAGILFGLVMLVGVLSIVPIRQFFDQRRQVAELERRTSELREANAGLEQEVARLSRMGRRWSVVAAWRQSRLELMRGLCSVLGAHARTPIARSIASTRVPSSALGTDGVRKTTVHRVGCPAATGVSLTPSSIHPDGKGPRKSARSSAAGSSTPNATSHVSHGAPVRSGAVVTTGT